MSDYKCKQCGAIFEADGSLPTEIECNCDSHDFEII